MLLAKDRILGETMIRMVPTPKPDSNFNSDLDPNHSLEQVVHNIDSTFTDFDLSFLPSAGDCCNLDELPDSPSIGKKSSNPCLISSNPNMISSNPCLKSSNPCLKSSNPFLKSSNPCLISSNPFLKSSNPFLKSSISWNHVH